MMKKIINKIIGCLFALTSLVSCSFVLPKTNNKIDVTFKNGLSFKTFRNNSGYHDLPSIGDSSILVIPVVFKDCTLNEETLEVEHERLQANFFGKSEDTYWESVASFYQKSSYGKLNIKGKVSDYFYYDKTVFQANKVYEENIEPTYTILEEAINWYKQNNQDIKDYDSNNDGYIDSVWLVYMEDYNSLYFQKYPAYATVNNMSEFLWAYTYWYTHSSSNKNSPNPFSYAWGSYKFTYDGSDNLPDAHTFIHETGHLLGLDDYYNYDYNPTAFRGDKTKPCGGLDMMDLNILDHNAYSKYLLGWIDPTVIGENGEYTLNAFQDDGSALIVPCISWNGSPLDEYLILEFYTPTLLNELDSSTHYQNAYPLGFTQRGVKIYHVDSRLGAYKVSGGSLSFMKYLSSPNNAYKEKLYYDIANSNTPSRSNDNKKLITLLSSTGVNRYFTNKSYNCADNADLFKDGSSLNKYKFNQYNDNDLKISIDDVTSTSCVIKVEGIGK